MAVYLELTEVNSNLRGILAPLILGGSAAAYVASAGGVGGLAGTLTGSLATVKGGVLFLAGRTRDLVVAHAGASAVAGVAATAVVATTVVMATNPGGDNAQNVADRPAVIVRSATSDGQGNPGPGPSQPGPGPREGGGRSTAPAGVPTASAEPSAGGSAPGEVPIPLEPDSAPPDPTPTEQPTEPAPSDTPTETPTDTPTEDPSGDPSTAPEPTAEPEPTSGPGPGTEPEPDHDLSVTARASALGGLAWRVVVDVDGVPTGEHATVTVTPSSPAIALTLDPRCAGLRLDTARCQVGASSTFRFLAVAIPGRRTTLTFTVSFADDTVDPDASDNTTTVDLH